MSDKVLASTIANWLNTSFIGNDREITEIVSLRNLLANSLSFISKKGYQDDQKIGAVVIVPHDYDMDKESKNTYILSHNPRLDFIKASRAIQNALNVAKTISSSAIIGKNCSIGNNVAIGHYCVINDNVSIGDNTIINNHIVIESNTVIGENCYIKSGAIIGEDGFGFEKDENGIPLRFPHIGNVIIGDNVEIGAHTTIARGTLDSTIIKDNVKIDDQVFIAHNVVIDENTMIVACSEISGSTKIGKNCWIGPNSTIKDGLVLGDGVFLGMTSVISKNLPDNTKIGSLSNLSFKDIVKFSKLLQKDHK